MPSLKVGTGIGAFEMTNAVPGGVWFVDANYTDKTDTGFQIPIRNSFEPRRAKNVGAPNLQECFSNRPSGDSD